ncbi:ribosomal protein S5 domain 2-type protein [Lentinula aff. lateritia]|uniref:Ribosomal protein S5 domain 2-type protein n=1 Tax=Lentinula aff. lateritia TaxID=2804960 RepID=A0ACC1TQ02_9AGAR|nr:ribosomal protein S5 domain 2-type protein [Lentinula aff. lateritia]
MAAEQPIPVYTNLSDLYGSLGTSLNHAEKWNNIAEEFQRRFGRKPAYISRAPGRVNLIGEHIDYCLFGVLPAAIERDILIAIGRRPNPNAEDAPGSVVAENVQTKYTRQVFAPAPRRRASVSEEEVCLEEWHLDIDTKQLRWESYVKAGYYGVLINYFAGGQNPVSIDLLVTGTVPAGSGLSSSAAMVVASTLAFLAVNEKLEANFTGNGPKVSKGQLVEMAVANEKRVGVNSGGMDQAASVISVPSSALHISFFPELSASAVPLPTGAIFIIANSLVVSDKAVTAKHNYNLRVVETLAAARILARHLELKVEKTEKVTLREVVGRFAGEVEEVGAMPVEWLLETLKRMEREIECLKPQKSSSEGQFGVTMEEMIEMSGMTVEEFKEVYLSWVEVEATQFQLYKRAKHVFSEASRVLQFRQICLAAESSPSPSDVIKDLGKLMNESQTSCDELFQCSCPELNELTNIAKDAGAIGSRLTGAGWGGCTVSLVAEGDVDAFIKKVSATYGPYKGLQDEALSEVIFATKPSSGACVYKFD